MEIALLFTFRNKRGVLSSVYKYLKLPAVSVGALALEFNDDRCLEIAHVLQGETIPSGAIRGDVGALQDAMFEFEDDYPRRCFEAQVKDFAATNPDPLKLAIYAGKLALELGININDLATGRAIDQLPDDEPDDDIGLPPLRLQVVEQLAKD